MERNRIKIVIVTLEIAALLLCSCSMFNSLPPAARLELQEQITALPGSVSEFHIKRAWKGVMPAGEMAQSQSSIKIWCIEVEMEFSVEIEDQAQPVIWIVTRAEGQSEWTAAILMTMSSLWPYQACGVFD